MVPFLRQAPEDAREATLQETVGGPIAVLRRLLHAVEVAVCAGALVCQVQHERTAAGCIVKLHPHADLRGTGRARSRLGRTSHSTVPRIYSVPRNISAVRLRTYIAK